MTRTKTPEGVRLVSAMRTRSYVQHRVFVHGVLVGHVVGRQERNHSSAKMWDYHVGTEFSMSRDAKVYPSRTAGQALDNLLFALDATCAACGGRFHEPTHGCTSPKVEVAR